MTPSQKQMFIRATFKRCTSCFRAQPETGGVVPPTVGPRNRDWWFTEAGPSGLWYYDYFIQQSMNSYLSGVIPPWCIKASVTPNLVHFYRSAEKNHQSDPDQGRKDTFDEFSAKNFTQYSAYSFAMLASSLKNSNTDYAFQIWEGRHRLNFICPVGVTEYKSVFIFPIFLLSPSNLQYITASLYISNIPSNPSDVKNISLWTKISEQNTGNYIEISGTKYLYFFCQKCTFTPGSQHYFLLTTYPECNSNVIPFPEQKNIVYIYNTEINVYQPIVYFLC